MSLQAKAGAPLDWSFGLRNENGKYLTAESFAFKLACSAREMKKKQIWFLEHDSEEDQHCFIKSHLGNYLYINGDGMLKCDKDSKSDEAQLVIDPQDDGTWAIKSNKYGWYFKTPDVERNAFEKEITSSHLWTVNLAMHPQVCLKNINRKKYMHLSPNQDSFWIDELIPWGDDATITLKFHDEDGAYGLQAANGKYLSAAGNLVDDAGSGTKFSLVFHGGNVAFKSREDGKFKDKFLTGLGATGTAKVSKAKVGADELFHLEDSFPQLKFTSVNGKKISIKQGVELAASQVETTDNEIFQVEPVGNDKWTVKSCKDKYWTLVDGAVHATAENAEGDDAKFSIEWLENKIALKASNGKYVAQQNNGYIHAKGDAANEDSKSVFVYEMVNRPRLVLRGEHGFVNTLPSGLLECNKSHPEVYTMHITKGFCKISAANGKFWKAGSNGVSAEGSEPELYTMSLHENSKLCLKLGDKYLRGTQNGNLMMDGSGPQKETLFEY